MGCPKRATIGSYLTFSICTHDPDTGELTDTDFLPIYRIYEDEIAPPILTGSMAKLDDPGTTGFYAKWIACTAATFEDAKSYTIYMEATVDGRTGGICCAFVARELIIPGIAKAVLTHWPDVLAELDDWPDIVGDLVHWPDVVADLRDDP